MSNDLIEKRDKRTKQRKERKKRIDSLIGLAKNESGKEVLTLSASVATVSDTNSVARLLDEGYCDNGFVLKKGALEKYLNGENEYVTGWEMVDGSWKRTEVLNLTDDFTGTVNLGHKDFATDPYILGEFKKSDFTLVDIENDRKALDIAVRLDEESMFVKELRRQPYDIGVSAEFWYHIDWDATDKLEQEYGMYMPVIDEIFIFAYGLVGECGNVNSSGLELKGEAMKDSILENVINNELDDEKELGVEEIDITVDDEPTEEADVEPEEAEVEEPETEEPTEEDAEDDGEETETDEAEDGDEGDDDEADEDGADLEGALSAIRELTGQVQTLTKRVNELVEANTSLKKSNRKLSNKLQKELDKKEKFKADLKGLSVELLPEEEEKPKEEKLAVDRTYINSGIGEL